MSSREPLGSHASDATETPHVVERRQARANSRPTDTWSGDVTRYVSPGTLARRLDVTPRTITRWCRQGRIIGARQDGGYSGAWRIPIEMVEAPDVSQVSEKSKADSTPVHDARIKP